MLRRSFSWRAALMPLHQQLSQISADAAGDTEAWAKFDQVAALAIDVKETDSLLALARRLIAVNPSKPTEKSWISIFQALRFVEIESGSVTVFQHADRAAAKKFSYDQFILKMAGGIVPMSMRRPSSRGMPILEFAEQAVTMSALSSGVTDALLAAMKEHAGTVCLQVLERVSTMVLLHDIEAHVKLAQILALPSMNAPLPGGQEKFRGLRAGINVGLAMDGTLPPSWAALLMQGLNELYTTSCGADLLEVTKSLVTNCERQLAAKQWSLDEGVDYEYRLEMLVALLRCNRLENAPSEFLASADELSLTFDFTCSSLRPLVERLAAMCEQLFDSRDDRALVSAIVGLLRKIVDLRPRDGGVDSSTTAAFQEAHKMVISAFAATAGDDDALLSEAYWIVVAHKFHGLQITSEVLLPLVDAMSSKGDGRVFNLADACVVYSKNKLDQPIVEALFRTCRVAGDHHRAKTLLQLLKDVVPGYLSKAPAEVYDHLVTLKVVPPRCSHLFDGSDVDPPVLPATQASA